MKLKLAVAVLALIALGSVSKADQVFDIKGTNTDTAGTVFTFDFTVDLFKVPQFPHVWEAFIITGSLVATGPQTFTETFASDGYQFMAGQTATMVSWGDFTCTQFDSVDDYCAVGFSEYNLVANQHKVFLDPVGGVHTPEPATLFLLVAGLGLAFTKSRASSF